MLKVHSIETFGTHDGPGIRLVLFLQGCAFRCVYCHNPDTQSCAKDQGTPYSTDQVLGLLEKQRSYFRNSGGLTVSGGEPTLQADELITLFTAAKEREFHLALDTSGGVWSRTVNQLYDLTDLVILDVKHIDDAWHRKITGTGNHNTLRNADYRERSGKPLWLRYVLVPGWTDQPEYLEAWARHFSGYKSLKRVEVIPYHTFGVHKYAAMGLRYPLRGVAPPTSEQVDRAVDIIARNLGDVPQLVAA